MLSKCDTCKKHMGVTIHAHADGTQGYTLYLFGGKAKEETKPRSHRLPKRHWDKSTNTVVAALDRWDEHCNTEQYKP